MSNPDRIELAGPHLSLTFDASTGTVCSLRGRFASAGEYGANVLGVPGIGWRVITGLPEETPRFSVVAASGDQESFDFTVKDVLAAAFTVRWQVRLTEWGAHIDTTLELLQDQRVSAITLGAAAPHRLLVGMFNRGVVQQIAAGDHYLASSDPLQAFYTIDHDGGSLALVPDAFQGQVVLNRAGSPGQVGLSFVTEGRLRSEDLWTDCDWEAQRLAVAGSTYRVSFDVFANDLPFPVHAIDASEFPTPVDAHTHYAALYGSSVAALGGYHVTGSSYPTISSPTRNYWTLHTFFDPDAWASVWCLSASGDRYLSNEARRILDRALSGMTESGQIPHHFDVEQPLYVAISEAPQSGPNLFWLMAALDYVALTGDTVWLREHWQCGLVPALKWLLGFFDPERELLCVNGPHWVDVFIHDGYTFDTNVTAIHVLERMADAAKHLGDSLECEFLERARQLRRGLESLWAGDHYLTERGRDWDSSRDMLDSDSYLAVALGITDTARSQQILEFLDGIPLMHPRGKGTWVSGVPYEAADCYGANTGDSATAMARMWWADLRARHQVGDTATFASLFEAVRADLHQSTWMNERYDSSGQMTRAAGYHEYPEVLDRMLREGYYGLEIGLSTVTVKPLLIGPFEFRLGSVRLDYSPDRVSVTVPGQGGRQFLVHGLRPGAGYADSSGQTWFADGHGVAEFAGRAGCEQVWTVVSE